MNGSFDAEVVENADNFQGQQVILLKRKGELININVHPTGGDCFGPWLKNGTTGTFWGKILIRETRD